MASPPQVLVCGAGPAGLVAALSLSKNGIPVRIIDQSNVYQQGTRGPGLQPRSLELLKLLGVLPEILKHTIPLRPLREYGPDGKEIVETWLFDTMEPVRPDVPFPNILLIQQSVTCAVLRKALANYGVEVELGVSIKTFTQSASSVTATLCKTSAEGAQTEEVVEVPYLIGTDGAKGVTRKLLGVEFSGESLPQITVVADVVIEGLDREHWHRFGDPTTGAIHALPIGGEGRYNMIIQGLQVDPEKIVAEGAEGLHRSVAKITRNPDIKVLELLWMSLFKASFRCAETFKVKRVFLGGDNAHVHSPMGGQGLNTSIQDSHNLAWKLALVLKGRAPDTLLDSYNGERLPLVRCMLGITQELHTDGVLESSTTHSVSPSVDDTPSSQARPPVPPSPSKSKSRYSRVSGMKAGQQRSTLLKQLAVHYRWSPIVVDSRNDGLSEATIEAMKLTAYGIEGGDPTDVRAGDRAPDAPVAILETEGEDGVPTTLLDLFSPSKHTAFVFPPSGTSEKYEGLNATLSALGAFRDNLSDVYIVVSAASDAPKHLASNIQVLIDTNRHAHTGYGIDKVSSGSSPKLVTVIVRPDAVVGAFVFDAEGVERYRNKIFGSN